MRTFSALHDMLRSDDTPIDDLVGTLILSLVRNSSNDTEIAEKMLATLLVVARDFNAIDTANLKRLLLNAANVTTVPARTILHS